MQDGRSDVLRVSAVRDSFRFYFVYFSVVHDAQVPSEDLERDVFCDEPFDVERAVKFTFALPKGFVFIKVDVGSHLCNAGEVAARVYGEEKEDSLRYLLRTLSSRIFER